MKPVRALSAILLFAAASAQVQEIPGPINPRDLIGEWVWTVGTGGTPRGEQSPSGERQSIRFFPDGTYKLGDFMQASHDARCTSAIFGLKAGVYRINGSTLELEEKSNTVTSNDNCRPDWNYTKNQPVTPRTVLQAAMGRGQFRGPVLILKGPKMTRMFARVATPTLK
jgi:hypothetical protein